MIKGVLRTEKALKLATREHTIPFIVDLRASKPEIKEEIERLYGVKVETVRTLIRDGKKIAFVKFAPEVNVEELASSLNLV
jgi:large subunit ribosomal protein L23